MVNTGIPLLDSVLEMFPWDKSEEYEKIVLNLFLPRQAHRLP